METLTFARYILEMCLLEYDFVRELDSMMAAACLLLVFKSKKELNLKWVIECTLLASLAPFGRLEPSTEDPPVKILLR